MKSSLFSVSFAGLWGQHRLGLDDFITHAAKWGYEGVELMGKRPHLSPLDYSLEDCRRLKQHCDALGVRVSAVAAYTNFTGGMESAEVPFGEMQVSYVEALSARAEVLGCDLVRIFSSYERDDVPFSKQWEQNVNLIRECCEHAAPYGVSIGLQNHHDIGIDTKAYRALIEEVNHPGLIPMYDLWSIFLRGEDVVQGAKEMAAQMRFTTVADYRVLPRSRYRPDLVSYEEMESPYVRAVPMGDGDLPYREFFSALSEAGFKGWASYETCSPLKGGGSFENLEKYMLKFRDYMGDFV